MRATGGVLGACVAFGGATEYQEKTAPHFHAQVHIASVYQHNTMLEIARRIQEDLLDPKTIVKYSESVHDEWPPLVQQYDDEKLDLEKEWYERFANRRHDGLSSVPAYLQQGCDKTMWTHADVTLPEALAEATSFKKKYDEDAQFVFSRVQDPWA